MPLNVQVKCLPNLDSLTKQEKYLLCCLCVLLPTINEGIDVMYVMEIGVWNHIQTQEPN